jgi:hypothetical protein
MTCVSLFLVNLTHILLLLLSVRGRLNFFTSFFNIFHLSHSNNHGLLWKAFQRLCELQEAEDPSKSF